MTVTRSSGSGMRDLPCAGDGNCPGFSHLRSSRPVPGFSTNSYTRSRDRPGRTQQTGIFCGKSFIAYIFRSQRARAQESKRARKRTRTRKQEKEQEQESKREKKNKNEKARERKQEQEREWQNPVPFKENYPPPRTCHSLIGCSPSAELSSRGRQSTWSGELPLAHAQIICLPLRTQDVSAILQRRM